MNSFNDIEFLVLISIMGILFLIGLKKRDTAAIGRYTGIDLPMSVALKGIACVLILMGHFAARKITLCEASIVTRLVYASTANIALALFMFFSGYGLSVKRINRGGYLSACYKRLKKVYIPLLLTCVIAMFLYAMVQVKFSLEESGMLSVPQDIWYLHNFTPGSLKILVPHLFGWKDWYVFCIMIFYSFFYLSQSLTSRCPVNLTWVLWLMLVAYFVFAYFYFGKAEAHWYRYCWAFFLGHVYGKMVQTGKTNKWDILLLVVLMTTIVFENKLMILSYMAAVVIIVLCTLFNKKYVIKSRVLAFMGGISYFFYLSHERLSFTIMVYIGLYSVLLWIFITIVISFVLDRFYNRYIRIDRLKSLDLK